MTVSEIRRAQSRAELLMKQLERKFGPLPPARAAQVTAASVEELDTWGLRLLDAATLDDVFR